MNALAKQRMQARFKYTWPFYILSAVLIALLLNFVFGITHKPPVYKTLTLFVSGDVTESKKLEKDMLEKYKEQDLKTFTSISVLPTDANYYNKLSIRGYNSADVLIIPTSKLENLNVSAFALDLDDALINAYYQGFSFYQQDELNYGVKVDKEKIKDYMTLPNEDCYMFLNGKSENITKEHNNALNVVKDWGM